MLRKREFQRLYPDCGRDKARRAGSDCGFEKAGIRETVMLTGDNAAAAENVAQTLGLDKFLPICCRHRRSKRLRR